MNDSGWISLHRKIKDNPIYKTKPFSLGQAWIDILLECNHQDQKTLLGNEMIICKRGESINSLDTWAKSWGWDKSKVRRFFSLLERESMIERKATHKTTHIKICNYDIYQEKRHTKRHNRDTIVTPNNNINNDNKETTIYIEAEKLKDRSNKFWNELSKFNGEYDKTMMLEFWYYWAEPNKSKTKLRYELEPTWDLKSRLVRWKSNEEKWYGNHKKRSAEEIKQSARERLARVFGIDS